MTDQAVLSGWISSTTTDAVILAMRPDTDIQAGQGLAVEAFGTGVRAVFLAKVASVSLDEEADQLVACLTVRSAIRFLNATQESRFRAYPMSISILRAPTSIVGSIEDVSNHGLGAVFKEEVPIGETLALSVQTAGQSLILEGEARYCRPVAEGEFRVGFRLNEAPRLVQARWNALVEGHRKREAA